MNNYFKTFICLNFILICNFSIAQTVDQEKQSAAIIIDELIFNESLQTAEEKFNEIKEDTVNYNLEEDEFIELGYKLIQKEKYSEAIAVFKMTTILFPNSSNAYDGYAESYLYNGNKEKAKENYILALKIDPDSKNSKSMLENLESIYSRRMKEMEYSFSPGQSTGITEPYFGQTLPERIPEIFASGIISRAISIEYACTFSPDGKEFYFTKAGTPQAIMSSRFEKGGWTFPEPVTFSDGYSAHEPHITFDNRRIYWGWFKSPPEGKKSSFGRYGIYYAERTDTGWSGAKYAGDGMSVSSDKEGNTYLTGLKPGMFFLAKAHFENELIVALDTLEGMENMNPTFKKGMSHPCVAPDGSYIIFDFFGKAPLFVSFKDEDGAWSDPINLTEYDNNFKGSIVSISPDGKYLFFGRDGDIYWVSSKIINELRSKNW